MTRKEWIEKELLLLHITPNYYGYKVLHDALLLALENEDRLLNANKYIYLPIAEKYGYKVENVTRNIRFAIKRAWENNPKRLCEISGYILDHKPTPLEFITMYFTYIKRAKIPF